MPCTSHFSFTGQWVKFSFQKSVVGEDKHLASLPLAGVDWPGEHVCVEACVLGVRNATN